jgi:hypothetical protein
MFLSRDSNGAVFGFGSSLPKDRSMTVAAQNEFKGLASMRESSAITAGLAA